MALTRDTSRGRVFHGWYIVMVSIVANATSTIGNYGFGPFVKPMSDSLGWSRTSISWALTIQAAVNMIASPLAGPLVDRRHGAMVLMMGGGIVLGVALMLVSQVRELWQFYLLFGVVSGFATMAVGPQLISPTIISKWFIRQRGRALAISSTGNNVGGVVFIPLAAFIILNFGWREAWLIVGIVAFILIAPLSGLFVRRTPEDIGLLPDGDTYHHGPDTTVPAGRADLATTHDWTLGEAVRAPSLWLIVIAMSLSGMGLGGLPIHVIPALIDKGYTTAYASALITLFSIIVIIAKPIWGLLAERIQVRYLMVGCFTISMVGMLLIVAIESGLMILLFPIVYGIGVSAFAPLMSLIWANYFGRASLGAIRGTFLPMTQITSAFGPVFAGLIFDATGSYGPAFLTFAVCYAVSGVAIFLARRPAAPSKPPMRPGTV